MAAGDVFATGGVLAGGSTIYYQPAAGVEILITMFNCNRKTTAEVYQSDGATFNAQIIDTPAATETINFKLFINNSIYFGWYNGAGSNGQWAITGMQLK